MNFNDLTDEQKEKVAKAKTPEELIEIAKKEGYELSDEELQGISGGIGSCWYVPECREHREHWQS